MDISKNDREISPVGKTNRTNSHRNVRFRVKQDGTWLPEGRSGEKGIFLEAIAIDMGGNGEYQVCTAKDGWLDPVSGYDITDRAGYGGHKDSPIIAVRIFSDQVLYKYGVGELGGKWHPYAYTNKEGFAGDFGPIDRFLITKLNGYLK